MMSVCSIMFRVEKTGLITGMCENAFSFNQLTYLKYGRLPFLAALECVFTKLAAALVLALVIGQPHVLFYNLFRKY